MDHPLDVSLEDADLREELTLMIDLIALSNRTEGSVPSDLIDSVLGIAPRCRGDLPTVR